MVETCWYVNIYLNICVNTLRPRKKKTAISQTTLSNAFLLMKMLEFSIKIVAESKVHGANMGPIWDWQDPGGPHVGPMNFAGYLGYLPNGPINNIPVLVQIMIRQRPGDEPLSEPMMVRMPTNICVTRPQWVKLWSGSYIVICPQSGTVLWVVLECRCGGTNSKHQQMFRWRTR